MKIRTMLTAAFIAMLVATSAASAERQAPTVCKHCSMKISPDKSRFSVVLMDGIEPSAWDDIGCAMIWRDGECAMRMSAFDNYAQVFDWNTGEALPIEKAFFVIGSGMKSPMGHDTVAFKLKNDAKAFIKKQGDGNIATYSDISSRSWKKKESENMQ